MSDLFKPHCWFSHEAAHISRSSAAHIIAEFTKKALLGQLPQEAGPPPSHAVIGAYLYICRQIYNTCEGLLVLYPYELHKVVAESWQEVSIM